MHRWTDEQTEYLVNLATNSEEKIKYSDMVRMLNKEFNLELSLGQVMHKLDACNVHNVRYRGYSKVPEEHINYLKRYSKNRTCTQLMTLINKKYNTNYSVNEIRRLVNQYNLEHVKRNITTRTFTNEQLHFIEERSNKTYTQIAEDFYNEYGISLRRGSVGYVITRYGMKHTTPPRLNWTEDKINLLKENASSLSTTELIELFYNKYNITLSGSQVRVALNKLGLKPGKPRVNYIGECIETSFQVTNKICALITNISSEMNISKAKFFRDALNWYIDNEEPVAMITQYNFNHEEAKTMAVRMPKEVHHKMVLYAIKNQCSNKDVFLQSILAYSKYIKSPIDKHKYDVAL